MPPRTRIRATKDLKENVDVAKKTKVKSDRKITKPPRKALADKTNSLSDDSAIDVHVKTSKVALRNKAAKTVSKDGVRPRRDRRLPTRYVENEVLNNLSKNMDPVKSQSSVIPLPVLSPMMLASKDEKVKQHPSKNQEKELPGHRSKRTTSLQSVKDPPAIQKPETPSKQSISILSPFKTPPQGLDSSLIGNRPKRICRLPSKFEDHSISPNKFIPVQPRHASTPITKKTTKNRAKVDEKMSEPVKEKRPTRKDVKKDIKKAKGLEHYFSKSQTSKSSNVVKDTTTSKDKTSPDTNNNPKTTRTQAKRVVSTKSPIKHVSPEAILKTRYAKKLLEKTLSFHVFEDRKTRDKNEDVYDFTFDPDEEPPPQKKKRKKVAKRRSPKPKTLILKTYDKNVQKAIQSLKFKVKPSQIQNTQPLKQSQSTQTAITVNTAVQTDNKTTEQTDKNTANKIQIIEDIIIKPAELSKPEQENKSLNNTPAIPTNESAKSIHMSNYASIHVEDIAADFEIDNDDNMNYSPVSTPCRPKTPEMKESHTNGVNIDHAVNSKDPLNLQGDSFFNDQPVASSSMNISTRHPLASPWRVEFSNLPIKWQADTYVKPNMTPAVDSSFINSEEVSKKHVYTNIVAEETQIEEPRLKQPSIISFMREVAERSLKKKRGRSVSPAKANSLFEDISNTSYYDLKTPKKARKETATSNASSTSSEKSCEKDNKNRDENFSEISNENSNPEEKSKKSKKNKNATFFGFDESCDQENVSPTKIVHNTRARGLRSKSRAVLQEINAMSGPTRAILPVTAKQKLASSDAVEKMYEQLKAADDAPALPEKGAVNETITNDEALSDEDQSVHLFEDIELVHHLKAQRKSYGKAKKVTFQRSDSDSDTQPAPDVGSSGEDDLADLSFQMPNVKEKKVTKKKKSKKVFSKKEAKEAEEWAAGFNSMCEDVDEFDLVVE